MDDTPITRQLEALYVWPSDGATLHMGLRGMAWVMVDSRVVRTRVWERLLDRDDLAMTDHISGPPGLATLTVTDQGRQRLIDAGLETPWASVTVTDTVLGGVEIVHHGD